MAKIKEQDTPASTDADTTEAPAAEAVAPMSGFVFGLLGAAVRKVESIDGKDVKRIVGYSFEASGKDANGKAVTVAKYDNIEAPYPTTDEAAKKMAADCEFTIVRLVDGKYVEHKLTGLSAAVAIARDGRPVETLRGRVRNKKITEQQLRETAIALYGFSAGDAPKPTVDAALLAAIMGSADASPEDKLAAMQAMLAAAGVVIK